MSPAELTIAKLKAVLLLADIEVTNTHTLVNNYWPETYVELRADSPWLLAETKNYGNIKLGWRKRVIRISWGPDFQFEVTEDNVTKNKQMVDAWGYGPAVTYLLNFKYLADQEIYRKAADAALTPDELKEFNELHSRRMAAESAKDYSFNPPRLDELYSKRRSFMDAKARELKQV